jgi:hypothetical protein
MRFKVWLFLVLFFSSFSVFSDYCSKGVADWCTAHGQWNTDWCDYPDGIANNYCQNYPNVCPAPKIIDPVLGCIDPVADCPISGQTRNSAGVCECLPNEEVVNDSGGNPSCLQKCKVNEERLPITNSCVKKCDPLTQQRNPVTNLCIAKCNTDEYFNLEINKCEKPPLCDNAVSTKTAKAMGVVIANNLPCARLRLLVWLSCKLKAERCKGTDDCPTLIAKFELSQDCIYWQKTLTQQCYANSPSHEGVIQGALNRGANCLTMMRRNILTLQHVQLNDKYPK